MSSWKIIAKELTAFCDTEPRIAQELIPELTRKLIEASVRADKIHVPQGNSIDSHGFDGYLETQSEHKFVPKGKSYWEFGTNKNIGDKAKEDYEKREKDADTAITYVFGTFRPWEKRKDFCKKRRSEGKWKDVLALGAVDYEAWLEEHPAISLELGGKIGKLPPQNIELVQTRLNNWRKQTEINLNTELVLDGRSNEEKQFQDELTKEKGLIDIDASSELEGFIFALSVLEKDPHLLNRALIIYSQEAWDQVINRHNGLILLYENFEPNNIGSASEKHLIVRISDRSDSRGITLSHKAERSFLGMGLSEQEIYKINKDTYGYLDLIQIHPLLKPIDKNSLTKLLKILDHKESGVYYSLFLAGAWNYLEKDKEFLEAISGKEYKALEEKIQKLHNLNFLEMTPNGHYKILLKKVLVSRFYEQNTLKVGDFLNEVKNIFIEQDETFFEKNSVLMNTNFSYSNELRDEVADTLIILALKDQNQVDQAIQRIIDPKSLVESFFDLRKVLTLLAEASPKVVFERFEALLDKDDEHHKLERFFEKCDFWHSSNETYLFSALEVIAWKEGYFAKIVRLLLGLAKIDFCRNKCLEILHNLFCGWCHNTNVSHAERIDLLKKLYPQDPEIIWVILCGILPSGSSANLGTSRPKYRDWCNGYSIDSNVKLSDFKQYIESACELLSNSINSFDRSRFCVLRLTVRVSEKYQLIFVQKLKTFLEQVGDNKQRSSLKKDLNLQINNAKEYGWSISDKCIKEMRDIVDSIQFDDPVYQNLDLFQEYFWDKEMADKVHSQRIESIKNIYKYGKDSILKLIELSNGYVCWEIGSILSEVDKKNFMNTMLKWLVSEVSQEKECAIGFLYQDVNGILKNKESMSKLSKDQKVALLQIARIDEEFLEILDTLNEQREYWEQKKLPFLNNPKIISTVFYRLLSFEMPEKALESLKSCIDPFPISINVTEIRSEDIAQAMLLVDPKKIPDDQLAHSDYSRIIRQLQKIDLELSTMANIEWKFLQLKNFHCKCLIKFMLQNPSLFIDLVFRNKNNPQELDQESQQAFGANLFYFLGIFSFWNPESKELIVSIEEAQNWIDQISDHPLEIQERQWMLEIIGRMLKRFSNNQDITSLHEDSLRFLDRNLKIPEIREGFIQEMMHPHLPRVKHGLGGEEEREKMKNYREYSKEFESRSYQNLSRCFDKIADLYEDEAEYEDGRKKFYSLF